MNKKTADLLQNITYETNANLPETISSLALNSADVTPGSLFFAIRGQKTDGHKFVCSAVRNGAAAIIVEKFLQKITIPQIKVKNSRKTLSKISARFFDDPTKKLRVIGITGTNGKTTTLLILKKILETAGISQGTIGTLGYRINKKSFSLNLTTPDIIQLQYIFHTMVQQNVKIVIMEVSSHALAQNRVDDIFFDGAIFTNLSRDHLDFHKTMDNYAKAKTKLFSMIPESGFSICNIDDKYAKNFLDVSVAKTESLSLNQKADFTWDKDVNYTNGIKGTIITQKSKIPVQCPLSGEFNLKNILAAVAVAENLGVSGDVISRALSLVEYIPGRLQEIAAPGFPRVFIDYAHTPDAVMNALKALYNMLPESAILYSVFGCGGNRDKTKRPLMTKASESNADFSILTSDNPRFEEPEKIIVDAAAGFTNTKNHKIIINRREAIEWTLNNANEKDIIAILGKGHETYQEIKGVRYPFDDSEIVREHFEAHRN